MRLAGVSGARFAETEHVDLRQTVSKFIQFWAVGVLPGIHPSLVTLRLVSCDARKPSAEAEEEAVVLDDPSLSLAEAGVCAGTAWLLAFVAAAPPGECEGELQASLVCTDAPT